MTIFFVIVVLHLFISNTNNTSNTCSLGVKMSVVQNKSIGLKKKKSMKFCTFFVTLNLTTMIQSLHKTLKLMMIYQPITFGCKDMVVTLDCMSPHCDTDLEDSKPIFLHNTLAHDDASLCQAWFSSSVFRIYRPGQHCNPEPSMWLWPWTQQS